MATLNVDAFDVVPTLSKADFSGSDRATCVAFAENNIFVGTSEGQVTMYRVQTEETDMKETVQSTFYTMQKKLGRGKQPVKQMIVNHHLGFLLVLCGDVLTVHDMKTLMNRKDKLEVDKVERMCVDVKNPKRLACAMVKKKKIALFEYSHVQQQYVIMKELNLPDKVLALGWHDAHLVMGYKTQYSILDTSGQETSVPVPLESGTPLLQIINDEEVLLAASVGTGQKPKKGAPNTNSNLGIFFQFTGAPSAKNPIPWPANPVDVGMCGDYIISVLPNDTLHIDSLLDQKKVQVIPFEKGLRLSVTHNAVVGNRNSVSDVNEISKVLVCSDTAVTSLFLSSLDRQMKQYLAQAYVNEAEKLLEKMVPSDQQRADFHAEAGFVLLQHLLFVKAFRHLFDSRIDPREVMALYPELVSQYEPKCPFLPKTKVLVDRKRNKVEETLMEMPEVIAKGLALKQKSEAKQDQVVANMKPFDLARVARVELSLYLWRNRSAFANMGEDVQAAVDTALLMLWVDLNGDLHLPAKLKNPSASDIVDPTTDHSVASCLTPSFSIHELLYPSNACAETSSLEFLLSRKQYNVLAMLYRSKGYHRRALETWAKLGSGDYKEAKPSAAVLQLVEIARQEQEEREREEEKMNSKLAIPDYAYSLRMQKAARKKVYRTDLPPGLEDTVDLLRSLKDDPLVWEFAEWVLRSKPAEGLRIFTEGTRETPLEPDKTLAFLRKMQTTTEPDSIDYVEAYLEFLVHTSQSRRSDLHDQLAVLYLDKVEKLMKKQPAATGKRPPAGSEDGELGVVRTKLLRFLKESSRYHVVDLLDRVSRTELYEELIILNSKMGEHKTVLEIYIYRLKDHAGAAQYCVDVPLSIDLIDKELKEEKKDSGSSSSAPKPGDKLSAKRSSLTGGELPLSGVAQRYERDTLRSQTFVTLLQIYFNASEDASSRGKSGDTKRQSYLKAVEVLNTYSVHINPVEALKVIPPEIPISTVAPYLKRVIPHTIHRRRDTQVVKGLSRIDNLNTNSALQGLRARKVRVTDLTTCPVCQKRLHDSYFQLPALDAPPVHWHCLEKYKPKKKHVQKAQHAVAML